MNRSSDSRQSGHQDKAVFRCGKDTLMEFSILTDKNYQVNWHHRVIAKELEAIERSTKENNRKTTILILSVPPRMGKSVEASINFPAWFLGRNPDKTIVTASYSDDLSTVFGSRTRDLMASVEYKAIFPEINLKQDTQSKKRWLTTDGGGYISTGVGGALTGFGAHCLLIDDPFKSREEADSITIRNKVWEWFRSTAYSRLEPGGSVVVIMQRWHKDDLVGRLINEFKDRQDIELKIINFPAIATEDDQYRKEGEALWPERYDREALNSIRKTVGELNWQSQFQQEPILIENAEFKPEYFKYFEESDLLGKQLEYFTMVDLAVGDKEVKNADDNAIVTVAKERNKPEWYVVDITEGKIDPLQMADALFSLYARHRQRVIAIEGNAYQKTFKFWLEEEMKRRGVYLPVTMINHNTNKEMRIRGLVPLYKTGVLFHRRNYLKLESQLLNFPLDSHDDLPDALSMGLEVVAQTEQTHANNTAAVDYINYLKSKALTY